MHGPDARDDPDVGLGDLAELRDLAEPAHAHLDDRDLGLLVEPAERQREADLVVLAPLGDDRARVRRAEGAEDVLRGGLRGRARDRDHLRVRSLAHRPPESAERAEGVLRDEGGRGPCLERLLDEVDPAADGDEEVARLDAARVDRDPGHALRAAAPLEPAGREAFDLVEGERDHAAAPSLRSASRATSRSSNGIVRSLNSCPCSCPFPAITTTSPSSACSMRRCDGRGAVGLDVLVAGHAGEDLLDDRGRLLAARVVGRDDRAVGEAAHDLAHQRALGAVAVAAAAEDAEKPSRREAACLGEHVLESLRRVRVVDEYRERLALVHRLEAPGHAGQVLDAPDDRVVLDPEQACGRDRPEDVLDVEAPAQPWAHGESGSAEARRGRGELQVLGPDVGVVLQAEREERPPERPQLVGETASVLVADVHGRGRAVAVDVRVDEEAALRLVVRVHRPVEVQVILGEVREDERSEARADEALELGRVRGGLHRTAPVAGIEHLAVRALEIDGLRRRADDPAPLAADPHLDGAEQAGTAAGSGEDRVEQERRRRLPVRPGDGGDFQLACRPAEERVGGERHRSARVADDQLRHRKVERTLDDESGRAGGNRVGGEIVAVRPLTRDADEERPRRDGAGVVGEVGDLNRRGVDRLGRADGPAEGFEIDGRRFRQGFPLSSPRRARFFLSAACILARSDADARRFPR